MPACAGGLLQASEEGVEVVGQRGCEVQFVAVFVRERDRLRVQEQARQAEFSCPLVLGLAAVTFVDDERVAGSREVDTDLVSAAGQRSTLQQAVGAVAARQPHTGLRRLAFGAQHDVAFAALAVGHEQGFVDGPFPVLPVAGCERKVILLDDAFAEPCMQLPEGTAPLREHEAAGG